MNTLLLLHKNVIDLCYTKKDLARIAALGPLTIADAPEGSGVPPLDAALQAHGKNTDVLITGWGSLPLRPDRLDLLPNLKLVAHSAGSVKSVCTLDVWSRGARVISANSSLAIGVAETTLGLIITGLKGVFPTNALTHSGGWKIGLKHLDTFPVRELFEINIGIIGVGAIGRHLIKLLKPFQVNILVYDPFLPASAAQELGVTQVSLDDLMSKCEVVTLHAPNVPSTKHMLSTPQFSKMQDNAIFINTARGALVDEAALINELKTGRIWAFIDVTNPEPPVLESPFRSLPNCVLTPHIAGAISNGCLRLGRHIASTLELYAQNPSTPKLPDEVTTDMLERIA